ncbi:MAG: hypothetical protein A2Y65_11410 [Deltaproteobacteria bacterium RBG_13_52_11]|nr:MAG: hypothetical protein A2Y65_11410 [Deltaproteobacteria bacterium RBG_13_52_11]
MKKILIMAGLAVGLFALVAASYDAFLEMGEKTVPSSQCNKCHKAIYADWAKDFHSKAFVNDPFKKASNAYSRQECLACHTAQEIAQEDALKLRPVHKEEGVNCTTCHLRNNMIYGPYKLVAKHKSEQDESMLKSAFCSGCHMPTYQEWQASGSQKQCQECHMPRAEGKLVTVFPLSALAPKRMVGQHLQMSEGLIKGAATITGQKGTGSVTISLTNTGAGHTMPTGKYGDYRMVLTTKVLDSGGQEVVSKEEVFSSQKDNGVPFNKTVKYSYPIPPGVGKDYKVKATLAYQVSGRPDMLVASWNAE